MKNPPINGDIHSEIRQAPICPGIGQSSHNGRNHLQERLHMANNCALEWPSPYSIAGIAQIMEVYPTACLPPVPHGFTDQSANSCLLLYFLRYLDLSTKNWTEMIVSLLVTKERNCDWTTFSWLRLVKRQIALATSWEFLSHSMWHSRCLRRTLDTINAYPNLES